MKQVLRPRKPSRIDHDAHPPLAVVVGIERHAQARLTLRTPVNDARTLGALLSRLHGYEVWLRTDEDASLASLRSLLRDELPRAVPEGRRVLFYFAGHGISSQGLEGPDGYLVPFDAANTLDSLLPMPELNAALQELPCRHLLLILDCCFAGTFRWSGRREAIFTAPALYEERYQLYLRTPAWQFLASSAYDERALDVLASYSLGQREPPRGTQARHSPFCLALLRGLLGHADIFPPRHKDGKPTGDGVITATELYLYLRDALSTGAPAPGPTQTPGLWILPRHHSGEYVFRSPWDTRELDDAPVLSREKNPYRGLEPFSREHAPRFFGRRRAIERLFSHVEKQPLTVVLAPSGAGKTSLVQAGLRPVLSTRHEDWAQLSLRPGSTPLRELAKLLAPLLGHPEDSPASRPLAERVRALPSGPPVVLIVDQLEELVTLRPSESEREAFLATLAAAIDTGRFRVVCTLRTDHEASFVRGSLSGWDKARFLLAPMEPAELQLAIEGPAEAFALVFEPPDMPVGLARELAAMPGALPLLSFTLSQLYLKYLERGATDRQLTQADYEALDGVHGALWKRARSAFEALDEPTQETMRHVLLRMVALEGERSRRKVPRDELVFADPSENERVARVLAILSSEEARLVVPDTDARGTLHVEPAHDALVRGWNYLDIWLEEEKDTLPLHRQLTEAARDWVDRGRDQGLWHDDPRLRQTLDLEPWLNVTEREFVEASHDERRRQRAVRNRFLGAIGLTVLSALVIMAGRNSQLTQRLAASAAVSAASAEAEGDVVLALLRASEAVEQTPADDPMRPPYVAKLLQLAAQAPAHVSNARFDTEYGLFSPDLRFALLLSPGDQTVALWDGQTVARRQAPIESLGQELSVIPAFSRDGAAVAAVASPRHGGKDPVLHAWSVRSGAPWLARELRDEPVVLPAGLGLYGSQSPLDFSSNGVALMLRHSGRLTSWSITDGGVLLEDAGSNIDSRAFLDADTPDGGAGFVPQTRYTSDGGVQEAWVELLDVATGQVRPLLPAQPFQRVEQVEFLGGARRVALVTRAVVAAEQECPYVRKADLAYHPTPGCVALPAPLPRMTGALGVDGRPEIFRLQVWEGPPWAPMPRFRPHDFPKRVHIVDVSKDGTRLLTTARRAVDHDAYGVRVWRLEDGAYFLLPIPVDEVLTRLRLSADGRRVITTSGLKNIQVYDVETGVRLGGPLRLPLPAVGLDVSSDGTRLAAVSNEGLVLRWRLPAARPLEEGLLPMEGFQWWAAFSPSAQQVISCSGGSPMSCDSPRLLELPTGEARWAFGVAREGTYSRHFAFEPEAGSRIASVLVPNAPGIPQRVELWRAHDGVRQDSVLELPGDAFALGFLPGGERLAVVSHLLGGSERGYVLQTWAPDTATVVCHWKLPEGWTPVAFTRSARHLVLETYERLQLWRTDTCTALGPDFTVGDDASESGSLARAAFLSSTHVLPESSARLRLYFERGGTWLMTPGARNARFTDDKTGRAVLTPPTPPGGARLFVQVGPGGHWLLSSTDIKVVAGRPRTVGQRFQTWDPWTGRALSPELWSRGQFPVTAYREAEAALTMLAEDGTVQRWFVAAPLKDEAWLRGLASAVTGLRLDEQGSPQPIPPEEHRALVESVRTRMHEAAQRGDANAKALLQVLVQEGPLRP